MSERKTNVKVADMSPEMQTEAIDIATKAIKEHQMETDIAAHIKKEFDKRYFPTWQCIVGRNFGADVEHEAKDAIDMKVCIREFTKEEAQALSKERELERYYSLYIDNYSLTLVDVTDNRARKILNFDAYYRHNLDVFNDTVAPLLDHVVSTHSAPQATLVIDGSPACRSQLLLGSEGLLYSTIQFTRQIEELESVFLSVVRLEDNNRLVDCLESATTAEDEPVIMEDTLEHFTSVEDATYVDVLAGEGLQVLASVDAKHLASKHVIFSLIFVYKNTESHPNTTVQFVSLAVEEVNRGMKSTRHAISAAAALIECRAPILSFTGTKVAFLLKPALLDQQPGAWISCLAPMSPSDAAHRETFKEAFCVAQLASRVFSARVGVEDGRTAALPTAKGNGLLEHTQKPSAAPSAQETATAAAPVAAVGKGPSSPTAVMDAQTREAPDVPSRPSIEREYSRSKGRQPSEEMISPSEFDTYRHMMDEALTQLRGDLRRCVGELEGAKSELGQHTARASLMSKETQQLQHTVAELRAENDELRSQLEEAEGRLRHLTTTRNTSVEMRSAAKGALATVPSQETSLMDASRSKELVHLVKYHQQEIHEHVQKEKMYRSRILDLESRLRAKEDEALVLRAKVSFGHPAKVKLWSETTAPAGDASPPAEEVEVRSSRRAERGQQPPTADVQASLRGALDLVASQNERLQYLEKELLLRSQQQHRTQGAEGKTGPSQATPVQEAHNSSQSSPRGPYISASPPPPASRDVLSGLQSRALVRPSSHHRAQSFEDFMNDAPHYKLRRRVL